MFRIPKPTSACAAITSVMHPKGRDDEAVEIHLGCWGLDRLLSSNGFIIDGPNELRPNALVTTTDDLVTVEWARRWTAEDASKARKRT